MAEKGNCCIKCYFSQTFVGQLAKRVRNLQQAVAKEFNSGLKFTGL